MTDFSCAEKMDITSLAEKRVLLLFPHMTVPGGALTFTLELAAFLAEKGAAVGLLTLRTDTAMFTLPPGVELLSLKGPRTSNLDYWVLLPLWQMRINIMISSWRPDVLIPQVFPANWWGWMYKYGHPGIKQIWVCHEPSAFIHSLPWINAVVPFWKRWLAHLLRPLLVAVDIHLSRQADRIVTNSIYTAGMVQNIYGRDADAIVYPGIEPERIRPGGSVRRKGIITVARLTSFKRIDFLLRVFARLSAAYPELVFNIVGQGDAEEALHALSEELGVHSRVVFHGSVDNQKLDRLYRESLLFLHGSIDEPFGMVLLEAIACGTPVVAHRSGGPVEIIDDTCGRLIDSLSVDQWSREVSDLLTLLNGDEGYFNQVHLRARQFTWDSTLAPIVPVIQELLELGKGVKPSHIGTIVDPGFRTIV